MLLSVQNKLLFWGYKGPFLNLEIKTVNDTRTKKANSELRGCTQLIYTYEEA